MLAKARAVRRTDAMETTLREIAFRDLDPVAYVDLLRACQPDFHHGPDEIAAWEAARPERLRAHWFVAEAGDALAAVANIAQPMLSERDDTCVLRIHVHPDHRRQGLGARLHDALTARVADLDPAEYIASVREDQTEAIRFLERRGYGVALRSPQVTLDLTTFDPAAHDAARARIDAAGFERTDFARWIARRGQDTAHRELHALESELLADVPHPEGHPIVHPPYDEWRRLFEGIPGYRPEGYRLAVAPDGTLAGLSMVWPSQSGDLFDTGLTGVRAPWRRQGVAFALKVDAAQWAKAQGATGIKTENAEQNAGMRGINAALGFLPIPGTWTFAKRMRTPESAP